MKKRRSWLRRFLVAVPVLVLVVIGIGIFGWWRQDARAAELRRAALVDLRQAGAATTREELLNSMVPVPPELNAAVGLTAAAKAIVGDGPAQGRLFVAEGHFTSVPRLPAPPAAEIEAVDPEVMNLGGDNQEAEPALTQAHGWRALRDVVEENQEALSLASGADGRIRPAVDVVRADFGADRQTVQMLLEVVLPHMADQRALAELHRDAALLSASEGDPVGALFCIRRTIGQGEAIDAAGHMLVEHLVALGCHAMAAGIAIDTAPHLALSSEADRQEAAEVIRLLMSDAPLKAGWKQAMRGEATMQQDAMDALILDGSGLDGESYGWLRRTMARPMFNYSASLLAEKMEVVIPAADDARLPEAMLTMPPMDESTDPRLMEDRYVLASILLPSLSRSLEFHYKTLADRRLAAVALACALWRADHGGALPPSLESLVPAYLPSMPVDPLARDGFVRYDAERALAWSVGVDAADSGGSNAFVDPVHVAGRIPTRWDTADAVIALTPEAAQSMWNAFQTELFGDGAEPPLD